MTGEQARSLKAHSTIWVEGYGTGFGKEVVWRFARRERVKVITIDENSFGVLFVDIDGPLRRVPFRMAHLEPSPPNPHILHEKDIKDFDVD